MIKSKKIRFNKKSIKFRKSRKVRKSRKFRKSRKVKEYLNKRFKKPRKFTKKNSRIHSGGQYNKLEEITTILRAKDSGDNYKYLSEEFVNLHTPRHRLRSVITKQHLTDYNLGVFATEFSDFLNEYKDTSADDENYYKYFKKGRFSSSKYLDNPSKILNSNYITDDVAKQNELIRRLESVSFTINEIKELGKDIQIASQRDVSPY